MVGPAHVAWMLAGLIAVAQMNAPAGRFTDRTGAAHAWQVSKARELIWEGAPYEPIGTWFTPRVLAQSATDELWAQDTAELASLKAAGVGDLIIDPGRSAAAISPEVWQRVIDHLEAQGFRYGIAFGTGLDTPLTGMLVNPSAFRIPEVHDGMDVAWDAPNADFAWFVVVDARDGTQIAEQGRIPVTGGQASIATGPRVSEGSVAILYPHGALRPARHGTIPDIWSGFDRYRDRLLLTLGAVKFGPGLRFFLDPLGPPVALDGDAEHFVPDAPAFRLEWEAFLARKYPSTTALATAWSLMDRDIKDYRAASGLIPLWSRAKGVPFLLDLNEGKRYQIGGGEPKFWSDLFECRDAGITYAMTALADLLKREVADVPVVYTHTGLHRVFAGTSAPGGPDGLGAIASGQGQALRMATTEAAFSQANDSPKPLWFLVSSFGDEAPGTAPTREALIAALDRLRGLGAHGVFVRASSAAGSEQATWISEYARRAASRQSVGSGPRALPYPAAAAGLVTSGRIGSGNVWWVPSLAPGRALDYGASYAGYTIRLPEGDSVVLWSLKGPRDTRLAVADPRKVQAFEPDGTPVEIKIDQKARTARLIVGADPVIIRSGGQDIFPMEAVEDSLRELRAMIAEAQSQKLPTQDLRYRLDTAEARYRHRDMATAYLMSRQALEGIVELMQPYTWLEAEYAKVQTFTEVVADAGASAGMYLSLNTSSPPPRDGYTLQLPFRVPANDTYDVWIACTPPGPSVSPFAWIVGAGETRTSAEATVVGNTYLGDRFCWMKLGSVALSAGNHTFTLRVTDRSSAGSAYALNVDAVLITREPFTPRGTARPQAVPGR